MSICVVNASASEAFSIFGPLPAPDERRRFLDALQEKPVARRDGDGFLLSVPLEGGRWCLWLLPDVPKISDLAPLLARAQALSQGFSRLPAPQTAPAVAAKAAPADAALADVLARLGRRMTRRPRQADAVVSTLNETVVEAGQARAVALYQTGRGRLYLGDQRLAPQKAALRILLANHVAVAGAARLIRADGSDPDDLEVRLVLAATGFDALWLGPAAPDARYVAALFAPTLPVQGVAADLATLCQVLWPAPDATAAKGVRRYLGKAALAASVVAAIALAWPVPEMITVTGTAVPADVAVAALPMDAVLVKVDVRVGDVVAKGQPVAQFRSQSLSEQKAQETLNMSVEELNAQAAMAKNAYGDYQVSAQRYQIAKARLAQIDARLAQLQVVAPADGRVVQALPQNTTGSAQPAGAEVVAVQRGNRFYMDLAPSRVDARRIVPDMRGNVYFRGLAEQEFSLRVLTPVAVVPARGDGPETLRATAEVVEGSDKIIAGLAGYARLEGPVAPRIVGLSHYVVEYIRVQAWTYLGLRL